MTTYKQMFGVPGEGGLIRVRERELRAAGPEEVLIRVSYAGVNRLDVGERYGTVVVPKLAGVDEIPLGHEVAGEVVDAGSSAVHTVTPGEAVAARVTGGYSEYAYAAVGQVLKIPPGLPRVDAAVVPVAYVAAYDAMVTADCVGKRSPVLITGGTSGVGLAAIRLLRLLGTAHVSATTRRSENASQLSGLGATVILQRNAAGADLSELASDQLFEVVIDNVGASLCRSILERNMEVEGRFIQVGRLGGKICEIDLNLLSMKRLSLIGISNRLRSVAEVSAVFASFREVAWPRLVESGVLPHPQTFDWQDVEDAHELMLNGSAYGKLVLEVS